MAYSIYDDLYRYCGKRNFALLLRYFFFTPGFRYIYLFRKVQNASFLLTRILWKSLMRMTMLRTGIQIPAETHIESGFRIVHFGHIVVHPETIIGKNFNICQGVTIGFAEGQKRGTPSIGDNVCVQPNAVIVGNVKIGNDSFIAPNAFVNIDIPDGAIALGNPCQAKSYKSQKQVLNISFTKYK